MTTYIVLSSGCRVSRLDTEHSLEIFSRLFQFGPTAQTKSIVRTTTTVVGFDVVLVEAIEMRYRQDNGEGDGRGGGSVIYPHDHEWEAREVCEAMHCLSASLARYLSAPQDEAC
jgi:hypothetical protein